MLSSDSSCCICENKDADQLRGKREADQRLCFRYIYKPAFCICENKDADQLRGSDQLRGNREADQRLCFRYIYSTIPLQSKYELSSL